MPSLGASVIAAVFGVLIGAPTLRLRGDYLAIVTLGFGEIFRIVANNFDGLTRANAEALLAAAEEHGFGPEVDMRPAVGAPDDDQRRDETKRSDQRPDQEHAHRAREREEPQVVEPLLRVRAALGPRTARRYPSPGRITRRPAAFPVLPVAG